MEAVTLSEGLAENPEGTRKDDVFWSFKLVEAHLVEARQFWWRLNRGGTSPYAGDGPWSLIQAEWGDYADEDATPPLPPLSRNQIARMRAVLEWLLFVPSDDDRRLVCLAIERLARGAKRVPWIELLRPMGLCLGADGLRMRYSRALTMICNRLNA